MSLELMFFFPYDPRLVNSYRIHFLIYQTHRKGKKSIESSSYEIYEQFLQIKGGLKLRFMVYSKLT
jgi:hypothetical protein